MRISPPAHTAAVTPNSKPLLEGAVRAAPALKGTMNALFPKDLPAKTHRGLWGRVEKSRSGDGLRNGSDVVTVLDAAREPVPGARTFNEAQVVRRIIREFASGVSPRTKARRFNIGNIPFSIGSIVRRENWTPTDVSTY